MGCEYTKNINRVLGPDKLAVNLLGMEHFHDQSQINIVLIHTDEKNIKQHENIHNQLFSKYSFFTVSNNDAVIGIYMFEQIAGCMAYELVEKAMFLEKG